jgi:hypothetical protein
MVDVDLVVEGEGAIDEWSLIEDFKVIDTTIVGAY